MHPVRCLLISTGVDARHISKMISGEVYVADNPYILTHIDVDAVILDTDVSSPEFKDLLANIKRNTDAVILVLADSDDELRAVGSLRCGADDCLLKDNLTRSKLNKAIRAGLARRNIYRTTSRIDADLNRLQVATGAC